LNEGKKIMRVSHAASLAFVGLLVLGNLPQAEAARGPKSNNPDKLKNPNAESIFKYLDKDGDQALTVKEFKDVKTGAEAKEAEARFKKWDTDGNGTLSLDEYKAGVAANPPPKPQKPVKKKK
jgi:hypothetical protein